ncbi:VanZ family protein [Herbivorax sp. ANBcel31]|uniref:VanZ family protein n=1 Tax=Herbivorax sp. ANBcel31 TaxID=3069754 RepID=UPI0027B366DF|nr:VanZ family protein [Herbivorax sp. ANBcel31]MDQ2087369.1 VanZ family protein [Herbivorax sp. ANBcel31]
MARGVFDIDKKSRYIVTVLTWVLVIFCMLTIISLSSEPAHVSREKSGFILERVEPFVESMIERFNINFININKLHFYIRKTAHVFIYFLLSILLCLAWKAVRVKGLKPYYRTWIMATAFSIIDETYQTFIPGRSGEVRDVFLDNIGITLGLLFVAFFSRIFSYIKGQKKIN